MIIGLGKVFGRTLTESSAKTWLSSYGVIAIAGRHLSQILASLFSGVGNAVNASTAATLTESIGWWAANKFDEERGNVFHVLNV